MFLPVRLTRPRWFVPGAVVTLAVTIPLAAVAAQPDPQAGEDVTTAAEARAAIEGGQAENVILLVGDGLGDSEITVARNYGAGAAGELALDTLPLTGAYTTYSVQEGTRTVPDYVTDSSAAATAWATGVKTYDGAVSVDPVSKESLPTILELASAAGFRTGNVTTAPLTDATPAVLVSHVSDRGCQGPEDAAARCPVETKNAGGLGSIAEQTVEHDVDVLMGGGRDRFKQVNTGGPFAGQTVLEQARALGYDVATTTRGMRDARPGQPFLGLFSPGAQPTEWTGPLAGREPGPVITDCPVNPEHTGVPHLAAMTRKAIALLNAEPSDGSPRPGFFLQVEGASIDKQAHDSNPCAQIGETVMFDRTVQAVLDFASRHPNTLVVVAADHAHTSQIIPTEATSPGRVATLVTADSVLMKLNYATSAGSSQTHTGTQVRIAAQGPQAAGVLGVTDQTDLFDTMARALGVA